MKVGFDYWQVISHYPNQIHELLTSLANNANEVHVISAVGGNRAGTVANAIRELWPHMSGKFFREHVHELIFDNPVHSPELKLQKCKELSIDVFFDDREDVCRLLNKNGVLAMRVTRKDNSTYDLEVEIK